MSEQPLVKELQWRFFDVTHEYGKGVWDANGPWTTYTIQVCDEARAAPAERYYVPALSDVFSDLDAAKAAAQADYERRILSALEPVAVEASEKPLRFCGYCKSWNRKPCGDGCVWRPDMPTELPEATAPVRAEGEASLREALEHASETLKSFDEGDPATESGWKHDELLEAWAKCEQALGRPIAAIKCEAEELERDYIDAMARAGMADGLKKAATERAIAAEAQVADLSARLARAVEVMRPFAEAANGHDEPDVDWARTMHSEDAEPVRVSLGDCRKVRAFLSEQENRHGNG